MEVQTTKIPGCLILRPQVFNDARGSFVKTFHEQTFRAMGLATDWQEEFYSVSAQGVLRGLHFQLPPQDHVKMVTCLAGDVLDAVVDLRKGSPTYGAFELFSLVGSQPCSLYIPKGLAHGFYSLTADSLVAYKVTTTHSAQHDQGIRWDSVGICWPEGDKIVSPRDAVFPRLADFDSPFIYEGEPR